jgi:hypothetical protein
MEKQTGVEFLIFATDHLLGVSPEFGAFNPYQKMQGFEVDRSLYEISKEDEIKISLNSFDFVVAFAAKKGYIERPVNNTSNQMYCLSDLGRAVKQKGGHHIYWEFIDKRDNAIFESNKWAKETAQATRDSARYGRRTMFWVAGYTGLTVVPYQLY